MIDMFVKLFYGQFVKIAYMKRMFSEVDTEMKF